MLSVVTVKRICSTLIVGAVVLAAGCGSDGGSSTAAKPQTSSGDSGAAAAGLPSSLRSKGTLTVAADATYPPMESLASDGHTIIGLDADLAQALGRQLGIRVKVVNATFDAILPGVQSGKYDVGLSSFTDTKEREKTFDFVTYFTAGTGFFSKADGGPKVQSLTDLCGLTVSVEKGTTQVDQMSQASKDCTKQGKKDIKQLVFPDQNGANLAISSGRAQVSAADSPVAAYIVKKSNRAFALSPANYETAPYGIAVSKTSQLAQPLLSALTELQRSGAYKRLLDRWGLGSGSIDAPAINAAVS